MLIKLRKLLTIFVFNLSLFLILVIGLQNSSTKKRVNLILNETINLPIGFIVGVSFITGSISGSLLTINLKDK